MSGRGEEARRGREGKEREQERGRAPNGLHRKTRAIPPNDHLKMQAKESAR